MKNWRDAAENFKKMRAGEDADRQAKEQAKRISEQRLEEEISRAAAELAEFLESQPGKDALELIGASGKNLHIAQVLPSRGWSMYYFFSPRGLRWCHLGDPSEPLSPEYAIRGFVETLKRQPAEFMPWLREELDKIAATALEPK